MIIKLDIDVGDIVLTGKFKNKRTKVKTIGVDELGQPTINGKPILKLRIEKLLPKEKQSKETRESMAEFSDRRFKQLAGLLKEDYDPEAVLQQVRSERELRDSNDPLISKLEELRDELDWMYESIPKEVVAEKLGVSTVELQDALSDSETYYINDQGDSIWFDDPMSV